MCSSWIIWVNNYFFIPVQIYKKKIHVLNKCLFLSSSFTLRDLCKVEQMVLCKKKTCTTAVCIFVCVWQEGRGRISNWDKETWVILSLGLGLKKSLLTSTGACRTGVQHLQLTPWNPENIVSSTSSFTYTHHTHTHTHAGAYAPTNCLLLSAHWFSLSVLSAHWLIVPQSVRLMALFLFSSSPDMKMPWPCVLCKTSRGVCVCARINMN